MLLLPWLATILAAAGGADPTVLSSSDRGQTDDGGSAGGDSSLESPLDTSLTKRDVQAGGKCGSSGGNAVCGPGLCCSDAGICASGSGACVAPGCQLSFGPSCDANKTPAGGDTSSTPRPLLGDVPYGVDLSHCRVPGTVALTFDDGPYIYTSEVLDLLARNGVKATFFVVGANGGKGQINDPASGYPPILKRMYGEGHQIGSHSWSHQDMSTLSKQQRRDQIVKNEIAISSVLGVIPTYFRPPYTRVNADVMNDLKAFGYHVTNYDIDTRDWQGDLGYSRNAYTSILSSHSPASSSWISLAHDIQQATVHSGFIQYMIDQARKLNYKLVTIGECMGDPKANWYRDPATGKAYDPSKAAATNPPPSSPADSSGQHQQQQQQPPHPSASSLSPSSSSSAAPNSTIPSSKQSVLPSTLATPRFGAGTTDTTATPASGGAAPAAESKPSAATVFGLGAAGRILLGICALSATHLSLSFFR